MAEKKETSFTVTDKRKFTFEGEVRPEAAVESPAPEQAVEAAKTAESPKPDPAKAEVAESVLPEGQEAPTVAEQQAQADAYKQSTGVMDEEIKRHLGGRMPQDYEVNFEHFMSSIYMTALLQLGLAHEQGGEPRVDLLGARNTIDTLALLQQKTKGNLSFAEQNFLDNCLYELRVAYVEVTNALTRPPQPGAGFPGPIPFKK